MLETVLLELLRKYAPSWRLVLPTVTTAPGVVEIRGALPQTMHFGSARLSLVTGELVLVDEDHRDGGDFEVGRVIVDVPDLDRVRAAAVV